MIGLAQANFQMGCRTTPNARISAMAHDPNENANRLACERKNERGSGVGTFYCAVKRRDARRSTGCIVFSVHEV